MIGGDTKQQSSKMYIWRDKYSWRFTDQNIFTNTINLIKEGRFIMNVVSTDKVNIKEVSIKATEAKSKLASNFFKKGITLALFSG